MASSCIYEECKVPAEADSKFCIFHAPSPKDIEKFQQALTSQIDEEGPEDDRNVRYSFAWYVFPASITTNASQMVAIQLPQTIEGDAWFDDAKIEGHASFAGAKIEGHASFAGAKIEGYASFDGLICRSLWLGPNMPRIRGWGNTRCGILITEPEAAISYWRFAQRTFSRTGEREKADAAFYFERLNRWRILRRTKAKVTKTWVRRLWTNWVMRPGYWVLFLLDLLFVRWTTAYGASVARLFFTWFAVIGGFGVTFSMFPRLIGRAGEQIWTLRNWIIGIHYSATTFATLGLGRINPGGSQLGMALTSIEAILGAVLVALAVLVVGRRFMRQG